MRSRSALNVNRNRLAMASRLILGSTSINLVYLCALLLSSLLAIYFAFCWLIRRVGSAHPPLLSFYQ